MSLGTLVICYLYYAQNAMVATGAQNAMSTVATGAHDRV